MKEIKIDDVSKPIYMEVKKSTIENTGKGVFVLKDFEKDELIEKAPYLLDDREITKKTVFKDYYFNYKGQAAMAFGYIGMINHSFQSNASYMVKEDAIYLRAKKKINKNEEIFINYGTSYWRASKISPV